MFNFSSKTIPIRQYSLARILQLIHADKETKEDAKKIQSITIKHVLNNETMNFTANNKVSEIFIFKLSLTSKQIPTRFISVLDKAFEQNNFFELFAEMIFVIKSKVQSGFFNWYIGKSVKV